MILTEISIVLTTPTSVWISADFGIFDELSAISAETLSLDSINYDFLSLILFDVLSLFVIIFA